MEERKRARIVVHGGAGRRSVFRLLAMGVVIAALVGLSGSVGWGQAGPGSETRLIRAQPERESPPLERIDELNRQRERLVQRARQRQLELRELEEAASARERRIRADLLQIHERLAEVETNLVRIRRQQEAARHRVLVRAADESARLAEQLRNLQAQAQKMQTALAQLREQDSIQSQELEALLNATRAQMRRLEIQLSTLDDGRAPATRREIAPPSRRERELPYERPAPRSYRPMPERGEIMIEPDYPTMEIEVRLDTIQAQVQRNSESIDRLAERLHKKPSPAPGHVGVVAVPHARGTIGSAGHGYGWEPNFRLYYLY